MILLLLVMFRLYDNISSNLQHIYDQMTVNNIVNKFLDIFMSYTDENDNCEKLLIADDDVDDFNIIINIPKQKQYIYLYLYTEDFNSKFNVYSERIGLDCLVSGQTFKKYCKNTYFKLLEAFSKPNDIYHIPNRKQFLQSLKTNKDESKFIVKIVFTKRSSIMINNDNSLYVNDISCILINDFDPLNYPFKMIC